MEHIKGTISIKATVIIKQWCGLIIEMEKPLL